MLQQVGQCVAVYSREQVARARQRKPAVAFDLEAAKLENNAAHCVQQSFFELTEKRFDQAGAIVGGRLLGQPLALFQGRLHVQHGTAPNT